MSALQQVLLGAAKGAIAPAFSPNIPIAIDDTGDLVSSSEATVTLNTDGSIALFWLGGSTHTGPTKYVPTVSTGVGSSYEAQFIGTASPPSGGAALILGTVYSGAVTTSWVTISSAQQLDVFGGSGGGTGSISGTLYIRNKTSLATVSTGVTLTTAAM